MTAALEGGEWSAARPGRTLPPGKIRYPLQEVGWAPGPVWTGRKSVPTGIRSRTFQTVSQSLCRLSYPAHFYRISEEESRKYTKKDTTLQKKNCLVVTNNRMDVLYSCDNFIFTLLIPKCRFFATMCTVYRLLKIIL